MYKLKNQSGSVLVFITLMIVILMVMVGMGLDTGMLTYSRSMGQRAVDMAALAGAAGVAKGDVAAIQSNIEQLNEINDYVKSSGNQISGTVNAASGVGTNVTLVKYNFSTKSIESAPVPLSEANGVRVALETANPYSGDSSNSAISTPAFLTPLINLFGGGASASATSNVNVSGVAVAHANPGLPIALGGCDPAWEGQDAAPINFQQTSSGGPSTVGLNNSGWTTYLETSTSTPALQRLLKQIQSCMGTGSVSVGTPICLGNGQNTPVLKDFEPLIDPTGETCYLAPVVNPMAVFNQCDNPIQAYAFICPRAICGPGNSKFDPANLCPEDNNRYLVAKVNSCNADPSKMGQGQCYSLRLVREPDVGM